MIEFVFGAGSVKWPVPGFLFYMTQQELRNNLNELPNFIQNQSKVRDYLDSLKQKFINTIKEFCEGIDGIKAFQHFIGVDDKSDKGIHEFVDNLNTRIGNFNDICITCIKPDYKSRDFDKFEGLFFDDSGNCKDRMVMTNVIERGRDFYRVRGTKDNDPYELYDHKGMYMMPHDHSSMVSTARFNLSGYPCLYLAESLYLAWEECRRPDFHTANFSRFRNVKKLTVLDLTIPDWHKLNSEAALFRSYLSLVCSVKATDTDKDHWQYRISSLFTRLIYQHNNIDGIKYSSSKRFEKNKYRLDYGLESAVYVFLPRSVDDKHCKILASSFEMTKAYSYFYFNIYGINFISTEKAATRVYDNTVFAFFERQLQAEDTIRCTDIIKS